jgi:hypothetical protein
VQKTLKYIRKKKEKNTATLPVRGSCPFKIYTFPEGFLNEENDGRWCFLASGDRVSVRSSLLPTCDRICGSGFSSDISRANSDIERVTPLRTL